MLTFLGDVALLEGADKSEYQPVAPYIFNCEYVIGSNKLKPVPGKINLKSQMCDYERLFGENPIAVTTCNNHINDFGNQGACITKKTLIEKGICIIETDPVQIGQFVLMAFMDLDTTNPDDDRILFKKEKAYPQIVAAKNNGYKTIVLMHWGIENDPNPTRRQIEIAHWLVDNGVDIVIGHHPHCVQCVEEYKGKYIFYSLGNGYFPSINQPSHYGEDGLPTRQYRFSWCKWNRLSYAVTVGDNADIHLVEILKQTKKGVLKKVKEVRPNDLITIKKKPSIVYYLRKYFLFFVSNTFVDGKIVDLNAVLSELKK